MDKRTFSGGPRGTPAQPQAAGTVVWKSKGRSVTEHPVMQDGSKSLSRNYR